MMGHAGMAAAAVRYLRSTDAATAREQAVADRNVCVTTAGTTMQGAPKLRAVGADERAPVAADEFRRTLGHFASGIAVICAPAAEGEAGPAGFACQSFSSLSLDPPLVCFMVARTSTTWPRIARAGVFCVNVLGADQGELCRAFAVSGADKFAGVRYEPAPRTGSPRLAGVPAWIDCTVHAVHTGGDHLVVVGRVEALGAAPEGDPLLFHQGRFRRLAD